MEDKVLIYLLKILYLIWNYYYLVKKGFFFFLGRGGKVTFNPSLINEALTNHTEGTVSDWWDVSILLFVHDKSMSYVLFLSKYLGICLQPKLKKKYCDFICCNTDEILKGTLGLKIRISKSVCAFHVIKLLMVSKVLYTN